MGGAAEDDAGAAGEVEPVGQGRHGLGDDRVAGITGKDEYRGALKAAAAGVDGQTWASYGQGLQAKLADLSDRLARGGYRPQPVKRVYIDKADGSKRPLGVPALEDKIVQRATVEVLNAIYERDFRGFSYGFRPHRSAHDALDAVVMGVEVKRVNWILDADIAKFFDTIEHDWLIKFGEHRVADTRVVRLIKSWLHAGVLEDGQVWHSELGTVQGGSISPLLDNIYLHYVQTCGRKAGGSEGPKATWSSCGMPTTG